jgi:hypothetical protein
MTKKLLFVVLIALVASIALMAADVSGKWTFEQQGRNGSQTVTLNLKADGGTLTGTVSGGMGRGGNAEQEISDGKVDGNNISFAVKREFNGNTMVITYKGTVDGDTIKLDVTRPGRGGGDPVTTSVTAKRATT